VAAGSVVSLTLDVEIDIEPPRGRVRAEDGWEREFHGLLGLVSVLNDAREREQNRLKQGG
jgi:hypothetical protein